MKIKHIYINKEGEPMANPYQDAPQFSALDMLSPATPIDKLIKEYHSGLLPFEDMKKILVELPAYAVITLNLIKLKPDTLIPVDLEVEVVEHMGPRVKINQSTEGAIPHKALRIKP